MSQKDKHIENFIQTLKEIEKSISQNIKIQPQQVGGTSSPQPLTPRPLRRR